jgi:nicotinate-nucleotide adenylyltransferase
MRIGIFGGSFDPIHHGHLILAGDAVEQMELDRLLFVPAAVNPFKQDRTPAAARHRAEMIRAAIDGDPRFELDERELHRPPPSYTVDTLREISAENPGAKLYLIIGDDNLDGLERWHRIADIRDLASFIVFRRGEKLPVGCPYPLLTRRITISSTEVRKRARAGLPCAYLLPRPVADYVAAHGLYL